MNYPWKYTHIFLKLWLPLDCSGWLFFRCYFFFGRCRLEMSLNLIKWYFTCTLSGKRTFFAKRGTEKYGRLNVKLKKKSYNLEVLINIYSARRSFSSFWKECLKVGYPAEHERSLLPLLLWISLLVRQQWGQTIDAHAVPQGEPLSPRAQCWGERDSRTSINARSVEEARGWAARWARGYSCCSRCWRRVCGLA